MSIDWHVLAILTHDRHIVYKYNCSQLLVSPYFSQMTAVHLLVLVHGMWGNPGHLSELDRIVRERTAGDAPSLHVILAETNSEDSTYDGVDWGGERVAQEVSLLIVFVVLLPFTFISDHTRGRAPRQGREKSRQFLNNGLQSGRPCVSICRRNLVAERILPGRHTS